MLPKRGGAEPAEWVKPLIARVTLPLATERVADAVMDLIEYESRAGDYIHVAN